MSQFEVIETDKAPQAIGPYSQAIKTEDSVYLSGQIPINPDTNELIENNNIQAQTERVLKNIEAILKEIGLDLTNIVKTSLYIDDMDDFVKINEIYSEFFKEHKPARSCVEVSRLPKDVGIEAEVVAVL